MSLTTIQEHTLDFIKSYMKRQKIAPTNKEIADNFNISLRAAADRVTLIGKKGYVKVIPNTSRGIIVLGDRCSYCGSKQEAK